MKKCPFCAEAIQDAAVVCKHCGRDLVARQTAPIAAASTATWSPGVAAVLSLVIPGAGQMYRGDVGAGLVWLIATAIGYAAFIFPGLILHVLSIAMAASGKPAGAVAAATPASIECKSCGQLTAFGARSCQSCGRNFPAYGPTGIAQSVQCRECKAISDYGAQSCQKCGRAFPAYT